MGKKMNAAGRAVGINFNWGGKIGPDTRDAHRLIHLAQARRSGDHGNVDPDGEALDAVVEGLFVALGSVIARASWPLSHNLLR